MDEKKNITTDTPPEEIEADIAQTRDEISGTVGAIRERMSAGHFKEGTKEKIRESPFIVKMKDAAFRFGEQARGTGYQVIDAVKRDPVPLAMVGVGIAWLVYSRSSHNGSGGALAESRTAVKNKAGELSGRMQEKAEEWSGKIQAKAEEVSGTMQEKAGELTRQARGKSSELAEKARKTAGEVTMTAREKAVGAKNSFLEMVNHNPLTVVAAAFAVGSAIGLIVPATGREREMMGSASERLLARAKETAQGTFRKAEHAAEKAFETAKEEFT